MKQDWNISLISDLNDCMKIKIQKNVGISYKMFCPITCKQTASGKKAKAPNTNCKFDIKL